MDEKVTLEAGGSFEEEIATPTIADGHFVLISHQGETGVGEVRVTIEYVDGILLYSALVCSIPSLAIMGWIVGSLIFESKEVMREESPHE
jgi:hypothetical protein